ncbi:VOC family protein [Pseudarthrobacter albicanus]|uniref:VOC family protein n=1 Tax=Pseudarthrobacter albicanus TaxID=2823873 RepID=UPI001BA44D5D
MPSSGHGSARTELAKDAHLDQQRLAGSGLSLGHTLGSRDGVDALLAEAERAGGKVTAAAHERPWGIYSGYFSDPDGHLWEAVYFMPTTTHTESTSA